MPGTDHEQHIQIARANHAIQMRIDEIQSRRRAPMTQQPRLDVLERQRLLEQRIVQQIDLPHRQIIRSAPPGMERALLLRRQRFGGLCGHESLASLANSRDHWDDTRLMWQEAFQLT